MSVLQAEVYEAFRTLDVPDEKALKAAVALSAAMTKVEDAAERGFSKRDADLEAIRKDVGALKLDLAGVKGEQILHRWMLGFVLATNVAIVFKLFGH